MPNTTWFPSDFRKLEEGAAVDQGASAADLAIADLERELRESALRQAYLRRIQAQSGIQSQNQGKLVVLGVFPFTLKSADEILGEREASAVGVKGYFLGGMYPVISSLQRGGARITFASKDVTYIGNMLSAGVVAQEGLSTPDRGFLFGGAAGGAPPHPQKVQELVYATEAISILGAQIAKVKFHPGAFGNKVVGYIVGGHLNHYGGPPVFYGDAEKFTIGTKSVAPIGATFVVISNNYPTIGNKTHGVTYGSQNNLDEFQYSNETVYPLGTFLDRQRFLANATCTDAVGFFYPGNSNDRRVALNESDRYQFDSKTSTPIGAVFSTSRLAYEAIGNSAKATIGQGLIGGHTWLNSLEEFDYETMQATVLGTTIYEAYHACGVGDYTGGIAT